MDLGPAARDEVVGLHEFFVDWFAGKIEATDAVFARFTDAMHPEFSMIVPSGEILGWEAVVASVRAAHATTDASFAIEIRHVTDRVTCDDAVVITYEEWQFAGDREDSCRVSTAVFVRAAEASTGVQWRHLHETYRPI
jgi:hypothetical protein